MNDSRMLGYKSQLKLRSDEEVLVIEIVHWTYLMLLVRVWVAFLGIQIVKVQIALVVTLYKGICLKILIASKGKHDRNWKVHRPFFYCCLGILACIGGLHGLGGHYSLGPLFLELGVVPQVASATSTFAMTFSASMSVVQNYNHFPIPYAFYFMASATNAAFVGQHIVRKRVALFGRASLIIFMLALSIFVSAISLGGVGIWKFGREGGTQGLCSRT